MLQIAENDVFNSLESYLEDIITVSKIKLNSTSRLELPENLFKIREEGDYSVFFMCSEVLLELLKESNPLRSLEALKEDGFFLLSPVKTNVAIGKGYEVSYCRNDSRIISRNLTKYGYVFLTPTASVTRIENDIILCKTLDDQTQEVPATSKRLIELFPKLYLFFNSKASHQALVLDLKN